jgi:hypothetical protein
VRGAGGPLTYRASLERLGAVALELGAGDVRDDATSLAKRLDEGRFHVACIGQFKRGKSTLLNSLIGHAVLPVDILPVTAVTTVIRFGERPAARVCRSPGGWSDIDIARLAEFVAEDRNPGNARHVALVEVSVPSALLADGLCFVDTPGLGSVFPWNAEATHAFVPHVDAAIVLMGVDPPLAGDELALAAELGAQVRDLLLVVGKADRFSDADRLAAARFAETRLQERLGRSLEPSLAVNALDLDTYDGPRLRAALRRLVSESGASLLDAAAARGVRRIGDRCRRELHEAEAALLQPLRDSERRLAALRAAVEQAEPGLRALDASFAAEARHLEDGFETLRAEFVRTALAVAEQTLAARLGALRSRGTARRRESMDLAEEIARQTVREWLTTVQRNAETLYVETAELFVTAANGYLARVAHAAGADGERPSHPLPTELTFRVPSEFRFAALLSEAHRPSPWRWALDQIVPQRYRHRAIERAARGYLARLFEVNGERVKNDLRERVFESRRRLMWQVEHALEGAARSAERALAAARPAHAEGEDAVRRRIARLEELRRSVENASAPPEPATTPGNPSSSPS